MWFEYGQSFNLTYINYLFKYLVAYLDIIYYECVDSYFDVILGN